MEQLKAELDAIKQALAESAGLRRAEIRAVEDRYYAADKPLNTRKAEINRIFEQAEFDALQPPDGLEWGAELVGWQHKRYSSEMEKTGSRGVLVKAKQHEVRAYHYRGPTAAVRIKKKDGTLGKMVVVYSSGFWRLPEGAK